MKNEELTIERTRPNANLIAVAPELLEVAIDTLKTLLQPWGENGTLSKEQIESLKVKLNNVILKAKA